MHRRAGEQPPSGGLRHQGSPLLVLQESDERSAHHQRQPFPPGSMASTGSMRRDFGFAEQAIEVVAHHRFVLTALLKQESRQG